MGDRGNVVVIDDEKGKTAVYLYSHWTGSELPLVVQKALEKRWRWDDAPYLTRIIFDEMTNEQHGEETGFGISTGLCDNEYPLTVLDCVNQKIWFATDEDSPMKHEKEWTFEEYLTLSEKEIRKAYKT